VKDVKISAVILNLIWYNPTYFMGEIIKAYIFDHDDTLVGTRVPKWAHHKYVADRFYGRTLKDEDILSHWGKPLPKLVCLLYGTENEEEALANNRSCHEDFPKVLFEETVPTLKYLQSTGKTLGVVTATIRFSFEHDLSLLGIPKELFDYTQTAEDSEYYKPDPRVFEPAIEWLRKRRIEPGEVLYVGDGLHDTKAALGAGFRLLGVETGLVTGDQFKEHGVLSIPNLSGFKNIEGLL
jgi:phosphoglycolate phosphatase